MLPKEPRNQKSADAGANGDPLISGPAEESRQSLFEIIWTSPVFSGLPEAAGPPSAAAPPRQALKYVHAFESDFFDSTVFSWDHLDAPNPTIDKVEPETRIRSFKRLLQPRTASLGFDRLPAAPRREADLGNDAIADNPMVQDVPSTRRSGESDNSGETLIDDKSLTARIQDGHPGFIPNVVKFEPREEEPRDWRPQGMVFFETIASRPPAPPRSVVYSTCELSEPEEAVDAEPDPDTEPELEIPQFSDLKQQPMVPQQQPVVQPEAQQPFFDFPDDLPAVPPEDTAETPQLRVRPRRPRGFFHSFVNLISWGLLIGFFLSLSVVLLYGRYARARLYNSQPGSGRMVTLSIHPGDNFRDVIDRLRSEKLLGSYLGIDDRYLMRYLAHVNENSNKIKPGIYLVETGLSLSALYDRMVKGSQDFKLTIPEGRTAREVAADVKKKYETFDDQHFMELTTDKSFISSLGLDVPSLEGYLYPSTYFFGPGMKEEELIRLMVGTFRHNVESKLKDVAKTDELSFHQHVIMASLIEKEARMDDDRPLIASVIFNRLNKDMPLQIDATVNYALNEWRRLTYADLKVESPYNTYQIKGLPPGPITNPRIASLLATFNPPTTTYLYYVHQGDGHHAFAETFEEHQANTHRFIKGRNDTSQGNATLLIESEQSTTGSPESIATPAAAAPAAKRTRKR